MRKYIEESWPIAVALILVYLCLLVGSAFPKSPPEYGIYLPCTVERIVDGDTVVVRTLMGFQVKIRFTDASSPERDQRGGKKATQALIDEAEGQEGVVHLLLLDRDTWLGNAWTLDRWLGRVWINKRKSSTLGEWQIKQGNAREEGGGKWGR
jgi:endonuclease YncB( thermonuclease family)